MISGLYLGELVRYVLLDLTCKKLLFRGNFPSFLKTHGSFKSLFISEIERLVEKTITCFLENGLQFFKCGPVFFRDAPGKYFYTRWVLAECLNVETFDSGDEVIVRRVCAVVATRGAFLAGAGRFNLLLLICIFNVYFDDQKNVFLGLAALLWRMDRKRVTVGVDGSLFKFHPKMRDRMEEILDQLKPGGVNVSRVTPLAISWITLDSHFALFIIFSSNWCYRRMAVVKGRLLLLLLPLKLQSIFPTELHSSASHIDHTLCYCIHHTHIPVPRSNIFAEQSSHCV